MIILQVTLWMYATALQRSWDCLLKNWVVSFAPVVYGIGLTVIATLVGPLGMIGGFIYSFASSACISSALYLIKHMVDSGKTDVNDFLSGFKVYIWHVITISFFRWILIHVEATVVYIRPNTHISY